MEQNILPIIKKFEIPESKQTEVMNKLKRLIKETKDAKTRKWKYKRPQCIQTYLNIRLFPTFQKKLKEFCKEYSIQNKKAFELELMKLIHSYCQMDLFYISEYNFYKYNHRKTRRQLFDDLTKTAEKELNKIRPPCKELSGCHI